MGALSLSEDMVAVNARSIETCPERRLPTLSAHEAGTCRAVDDLAASDEK